jgi:hypothetical protein
MFGFRNFLVGDIPVSSCESKLLTTHVLLQRINKDNIRRRFAKNLSVPTDHLFNRSTTHESSAAHQPDRNIHARVPACSAAHPVP